ncbi:hypothetical protein [Roseovarius sp. M141]|uniref:capsular polysaccharide export protein, LipB/KpsS family n=1 Tax=Roseovarius sp. M141 TaxID=2583806 RepID=UPI0020CBE25F|nr:hypothetical protein [Roseovarius sp. M141]MCQ0092860.1 hypothetical protein [Roseovarius sp. M141]
MPRIVLHLKKNDLARDLTGWHLRLYPILRSMAQGAGIGFDIRARDSDIKVGTRSVTDGRFDDGNLHIIDDRSVVAANVLNAGVAYFWEFWHLDPSGVKAFSSIGNHPYAPGDVPFRKAKPFFDMLRDRHVAHRRSKYAQPEAPETFPPGALAVFLQGTYPLQSGATDISDLDMLRCVLDHAGDRPVIVKPHPLASTPEDVAAAKALAQTDSRLIVSCANVHDILATSAATVSINSTVALEGFLHRVPALLLGKSDFHHIAGTVTQPAQFAQTLTQELERRGGYAQYLTWYFRRNCLPLHSADLTDRIWKIFGAAGFPPARFGL